MAGYVKIMSDSGSVTLQAEDVSGNSTATLVNVPAKIGHAEICIACSDETTALTLTEVRASVTTAPAGSALTVDVNDGGTSIFSTLLTIDAGEKTSTTAATPAVLSDTALADDAEITGDVDAVGSSTAGAGLKVWLMGYWS